MSAVPLLIDELESALQSSSMAKRTEFLRRVTDLFLGGADHFSPQQVSLFDGVMTRLIAQIERKVLAELSQRLAPVANAPAAVVQRLASDDDIAVAGPVLQESARLTDDHLVEIAAGKGQQHLVSISRRSQLNEKVTDVLVERGDTEVLSTVAANAGAQLSETGFSKLAVYAEGDDMLTELVARRADVPPLLFRHVLARATSTARERLLLSAPPEARDRIRKVLADVSNQMRRKTTSQQHAQAQQLVSAFSQDTALTKAKVWEFAVGRKIPEMVVALSVLTAVPVDLVEHLVTSSSALGILVLGRAIGLNWLPLRAVISSRYASDDDASAVDWDDLQVQYQKLAASSAQRLLRFWQARQDQAATVERPQGQAPRPAPALAAGATPA